MSRWDKMRAAGRVRRRLVISTVLAGGTGLIASAARAESFLDGGAPPLPPTRPAGLIAAAHSGPEKAFDIPRGELAPALRRWADISRVQVLASTQEMRGLRCEGLAGAYAPEGALRALLTGTGLDYEYTRTDVVAIVNPQYVQFPGAATEVTLEELSVEGRGPGAGVGQPPPTGTIGQPPVPYAGGQVASGGRVGFLGNRSVFDTPFTQNNYTEQVIRDQGSRTVLDVLANDPSVRGSQPPFGFADNVYIRGFLLNARDFAFDGLYGVTDPRRPIIEGISRVEVLHGPGAFLFGFPPANSIGGVVNLVPKRATDEPITRVSADYLSRGNGGGQVDIGRRFGDGNSLGVRVNAFYHDGQTPIDFQSIQNGGATIGLDYRGEAFRFSIDVGYHHLHYDAPNLNYTVLPGVRIPRAPDLTINQQQRWTFVDTSYGFGAARAEYDIVPGWTAFAAMGGSSVFERFLFNNLAIRNANGDINATTSANGGPETQFSVEGGVRGNLDTGPFHHAVSLTATEYLRDNPFGSRTVNTFSTNLYAPTRVPAPSRVGLFPPAFAHQPAELTGLAGVDTITVIPGTLDVIGGARAQWISQQSRDFNTGAVTASFDNSAVTPLGAAVLKPTNWLSLYASYAQGLGFGPTAPANAVNANATFPPVVSTQIETGAKLDFGIVGLTFAFFEITQPSGFLDPATRVFGVNGEQRNRGFEFNVFGEPTPGLRLLGGVTLLDGILTKTAGGTFNGKVAPGVPDAQLNLGAEVDLPRWLAPGLTFAARVIHTSSQYYDQANSQKIPDWTRLDLGLRYRFVVNDTPLVARFFVDNVMGLNYYAFTGQGGLTQGQPRTFRLSLQADL